MLVCMGAAIVMAMGHYMQEAFQTGDPARLGAQVISGIGFYSAGILATLAVYLIMARFKKLEYKFILEDVYCGVYVEFNGTVTISDIAQRASGTQNTYFKDYGKGAACLGLSQMGGAFCKGYNIKEA